jgi:hypothetical protein
MIIKHNLEMCLVVSVLRSYFSDVIKIVLALKHTPEKNIHLHTWGTMIEAVL